MIAYMISGEGNISIILNGTQYNVLKGADTYDAVLQGIKENLTEEELLAIVNPSKKVADYFYDEDVKIEDGEILYKGEAVHNTLTDRIITFMKEGLPVNPLFAFLKKVMENPSFSARKELFDFLSHKSLPITEDGDFLAYKAVKNDYFDKYSGKVNNAIGTTVEMGRFGVDDDRNNGCSAGLHAGTLEYVNSYGRFTNDEGSDKCIIVKINPSDVVSVPSDCNCQKLRTCKYLVLRDYEGELVRNLYTNEGQEYDDDEDDYCSECGEHFDDCECPSETPDEPQKLAHWSDN